MSHPRPLLINSVGNIDFIVVHQLPPPNPAAPRTRGLDHWRLACSMASHPSSCDRGAPLAAAIAEGLAAVSLPWELFTGTRPSERCYQVLLATPHYDAWLIHWPAGTGLAPHDHGGSGGAFSLVDGVLDEDVVVDGVTTTRRLATGDTVVFGSDHVHAVRNRGDRGATSVHVYSPPLGSMGFYRADDDGLVVDHVADDWTIPRWDQVA
jgi:Cysteine dioxygenase type I